MKVLRGTLTFVLGMIIGIILFVVAIGGTVAILATKISVGDLQDSITSNEVISSDSELYDKTIFEAVQGVIKDVQNFDKLSLKTLYEHYGIKLLNGISGIDFTTKDFYSVPIPDLVNDLSIIVNSFTLNDVSKIAGVDFSKYNLPILTNNLNNNISTAVDNIMNSLNGNLSIRAIKDNFGIDLGTESNALLATLQDVKMSEFGNVINVLFVDALLNADTDTFILANDTNLFVEADEFELIEANGALSNDLIYEKSLLGGKDTDNDGIADKMTLEPTLYTKKITVTDGVETEVYIVDNSKTTENIANGEQVYRHVIYKKATAQQIEDGENLYLMCYANRVDSILSEQANDAALVKKGLYSLSELDLTDSRTWALTDKEIDKDSKLDIVEGSTNRKTYQRVHEGTSAALLQTIAHLTVSELQNADNLLANLTISDVIDITDDTAKIIKSLAARNCKLLDLGTVANELTLNEMIDIVNYSYEESSVGKYVYITEGNYYTLYNPALHDGLMRYNRITDDGTASSALLQRFAGATLGGFSTAFDELMLADVLEIDADVYAPVDLAYITEHEDERFFYFDSKKSVFRVANAEYIAKYPSTAYYRIAQSGESASFIKKLAYVKVDTMSDAMEVIIDDMMLSEFIDVYKESAVKLGLFDGTFDENGSYLIDFETNENYVDESGTKYVYVYDIYGDYAKANFRPMPITQNVEEDTIYYTYKPYSTLGSTPAEVLENSAQYTAKGNLYYFDGKTKQYSRNMVLCTYMLTHTEYKAGSLVPTLSGKYLDNIYYREAVAGKTDADVDNKTLFKGTVYSYTGDTLEYGVVVRDNFRGYLTHIPNDPAFADKQLYTFEKSADGTPKFIINKDDVQKLATAEALKDKGFVSPELYYARRQCEKIYVLATEGEYVFVDGQYVPYDGEIHSADLQRFDCKLGYIGLIAEVSYLVDETRVTEFDIKPVTYIREKSSPVLRLLARGTIGEINKIISDAKVGDIIDAEPGSLFDNDQLKKAKISELGNVFSDLLTNMTIGDLIVWSHVTDVNEYVRLALENVTLQKLISSMVLDETTHEIKVDMLKLYGYNN